MQRARVLILWNQVDEDVVDLWRRDGRRTPEWDPTKIVEPWDTVAEEIALIERSVAEGGYDVVVHNIEDSFEKLMDVLEKERPDVVLNLVECFHDDLEHEMHVPALYELLGLSYTGNRPLALALCQKKPHAKALLAGAGLPVPRGIVVETGQAPDVELGLRYPMIVKPAFDDASGGIDAGSVVARSRRARRARRSSSSAITRCRRWSRSTSRAARSTARSSATSLPSRCRSTRCVQGRRRQRGPRAAAHHHVSREVGPVQPRLLRDGEQVPGRRLPPALVRRMQEIAVRAFNVLGCRDYARVDMRLEAATQEPYILEVNPNPDFADGCAFAQCVRASGRTYAQALQTIVAFALERARNRAKHEPFPSEQLLREYLAKRSRSAR